MLLRFRPELIPLALLGLGDLGHHQLLPSQLLEQLLEDLPVVEVFLDVLHDDPLRVQLVVHPLDQDAGRDKKIFDCSSNDDNHDNSDNHDDHHHLIKLFSFGLS